ncbi:hypothetical protein Tco_1146178, partial [Tanacetum coccineum]
VDQLLHHGERTGRRAGGQGNEVNDGVDGVLDFSTIIAQQLQNLLITILAQVGNQGINQGNNRNQNDNAINDNIQGDVRNVIIEKMESVQDMRRCGDDQKVKYTAGLFVEEFCPINEMKKLETEFWNHVMVRVGHVAYTDRFHEFTRSEGWWQQRSQRQFRRLQKAGTITDEAIRNGSLKKNPEKRGNGGEPSWDRNIKDDNKRTRTGNSFATTANLVRREYNSIKRK